MTCRDVGGFFWGGQFSEKMYGALNCRPCAFGFIFLPVCLFLFFLCVCINEIDLHRGRHKYNYVCLFSSVGDGTEHSVHSLWWDWGEGSVYFISRKCPVLKTWLVSRLVLVVRRSTSKRKDPGSTLRFGSPFSSKSMVYGHCLVTAMVTINETWNGSHRYPSFFLFLFLFLCISLPIIIGNSIIPVVTV